jgi:hypothetical protein
MPMDRSRYPDDWDAIAHQVKNAAGWKCAQCGKLCRKPGETLRQARTPRSTVNHLGG